MNKHQEHAINFLKDERERQDLKWGEQNHNSATWLAILIEEVGEIAKAILEHGEDSTEVRDEIIHAGAVCLAWLECRLRNALKNADKTFNNGK